MNESIRQEIKTAQDSQVTGNMVDSTALNVREMQAGSFLISGDNNQVTIYGSVIKTQEKRITPAQLKTNPYQGLLAFQERDYQRFFGRDRQIKTLWTKLRDLYEQNQQLRFLPVYGPSGCGKSSLVRAGLIPELVRHPLPVCHSVRVATLVPGPRPLEALAMVLAKVATNEPTPVAKSEEFLAVLEKPCAVKPGMLGNQPEFCGLRKIAALLPEIDTSPLIVFVDQFEEIYSLCQSEEEREAFIGNLVQAAGDRSQQVTVVVTFRSDFLRELQQHPPLYHLFSEQGVLVRPLLVEELREAIAKPAELADHPLDEAVITLLLQQMQGQDHALPLLQFALTRIWEGLEAGVSEVETLTTIGGVGGALAGEAQRLYERLDEGDRALARRMFLGLVQLGEGSEDTRRRVLVSELVACSSEDDHLESIIEQFAAPGVRFVSVSLNQQHQETLEVTHEALIRHWNQLQDWIKESREALRKKRKIEELAQDWQESGQSKGYLLQGRLLRDAKEFQESSEGETALSALAREFIHKSQWKRRGDRAKSLGLYSLMPVTLILISLYFGVIYLTEGALSQKDCDLIVEGPDTYRPIPNLNFIIQYLWWPNYRLEGMKLCGENLNTVTMIAANLRDADLRDTKFIASNLEKADLDFADCTFSEFINTNLQDSDLNHTNFTHADLSHSDLSNASVYEIDFYKATLRETDLTDVNLSSALNLTQEQLEEAILCRTILPAYLENINLDQCVN
ncbi:pentapeptide repeat-containing protein [Phormidium yuhuli AB48]|uniref:Pentapeptide repeat-containing protein n=1 Tax=Phormidium yuhuli AB48 TaxID=2940671 RepID=A0ABY5AS17_9CYAN|nr:pentapeptide repeat-containing protein [Phormidium yuhuli]USR91014.1 pentapeptide repeat-containing protein [Phormidium yuhuli AB48]